MGVIDQIKIWITPHTKGSLIPDFVKFTAFVQIAQILANQPFRLTSLVLHPEAHFSGNRNSLKYTCLCVKNSRKQRFQANFHVFHAPSMQRYAAYMLHTDDYVIFR